MNNPKYDYFPFLRLLYYIRSLIGAATALIGIPSLISGEQEIYKYVLSLVAALLFFLIARFFTEKGCRTKIPVLFFFFAVKESVEIILTVLMKTETHLPSAIILFFLTLTFYITAALLCRFSLKMTALNFLIYTAFFCLLLAPFISFWSILENAFMSGEPQIFSMSVSLAGSILGILCNFGTLYIVATREKKG